MANKLISLRIAENFVVDIDKILVKEGFTNIQEFIKDSIRYNLKRYKLQKGLEELDKLSGSAVGKKLKSKKEFNEYLAMKYLR